MNTVKETLVRLHFFHKISPKENKYLLLLFSIICLLVVSPFFQETTTARLFFSLLISVVLLSGLYADFELKRIDYIETILGFFAIILTWLDYFITNNITLDFITQGAYAAYFLYFTVELISRIVISNQISPNLIYASIAGFFMLGLCGATMASMLELALPEAYKLPENVYFHNFENFIYYSFVTITTVGYGDMLPIHPASKTLAILLCVCGHLYSTIVMAIIIGKFSSKQNSH
ncbi:MAG: two pore domain potassium channel family protein [Cytophagales bacterium]|nr:MAG: two pore domain potassium channel family protein [Cytophagales bacterium]